MAVDPLEVQISIRLKLPRSLQPTSALVEQFVAYRVEHGHDHPRAKIRIIQWRNPARKKAADRKWRTGNQADAWRSLGRALKSGSLIITATNQRTKRSVIIDEDEIEEDEDE